jgi:hypothetical protein
MALICSIIKVEFAGVTLIDHTHFMEFEPALPELSRGNQEVRAISADGITNIGKGNQRTVYTFSRVKDCGNIYAAHQELLQFPESVSKEEGSAVITTYVGPGGDDFGSSYVILSNAVVTGITGKCRKSKYSAHTITIRGGDYTTV